MHIPSLDSREIPLFEGIAPQERDAMLNCLEAYVRRYRAGEFIVLDQDTVRHVALVLGGRVHMIKEDPTGHKTLLACLEAGEMFGDAIVFRRRPLAEVSFSAAVNTEILFLNMEHVIEPCKNDCVFHKRLVVNTFRQLGEEYRRLLEKLEICTKASLREKILAYLRLLSARQGQKYITTPLTRTEMAAYLESNRSAMTRELASMRAAGLIDFDGSTFVLKE
ncbi:MAG: Crp/Fnr family transcriptional regulator [Oscillospiraceae bacterium]|nr:Crp/Fnr family transcriptional regulator [Oscillospiraceae bacterium]